MRPCVQALLRPLLVARAPMVELGVAPLVEVPALPPHRGESWLAALAALLAHHGEQVSCAWLAGVSGAAWRTAWRADYPWCPSSLEVYPHDPFDALSDALGLRWRRHCGLGFLKSLELIRARLALGRPVLTAGLYGAAEWSVVVGVGELKYLPGRLHDEPPQPSLTITARTPFDQDGCATLEAGPWCGWLPAAGEAARWGRVPLIWLHGRDAPPLDRPAVLRTALTRAVAAAGAASTGLYRHGSAAYALWQEALRDTAAFETLTPEELDRRAWVDAECAGRLSAARLDGLAFLAEVGPAVSDSAGRRLLALAGREYHAAASELAELARLWLVRGEPSGVPLANPERRALAVEHLTAAAGHERVGAAYLARVLGRL